MACAGIVHEYAKAAKLYGKLNATVEEETVEDGTKFAPNTIFCKTWKLRNNSRCPWPRGTRLKHVGGNRLNGPLSVNVPVSENGLQPGKIVEVVVDLISPPSINRYTSHWNLMDPAGNLFGPRIWIMIQVVPSEFAESLKSVKQVAEENGNVSLDNSTTIGKKAHPISEKGSNEKKPIVDDDTHTFSAMPDISANLDNHRPSFSCELNTDSQSTENQVLYGEPSSKEGLDSELVQDVTLLKGAQVCPGEKVKKTWLVRNNGAVPWPPFCRLVCVGGNILPKNDFVSVSNIPENGLSANQEIEISVDLLAPEKGGYLVSQWRLMAPRGQKFGATLTSEIKVVSDKIKSVPQNQLRDNVDSGKDLILPVDNPQLMCRKGVEQEKEKDEIGDWLKTLTDKEESVDNINVGDTNVLSSNPAQDSTEEDLQPDELSDLKGNETDEFYFVESPVGSCILLKPECEIKNYVGETAHEERSLFEDAVYVDSKSADVGDCQEVQMDNFRPRQDFDEKQSEDGLLKMGDVLQNSITVLDTFRDDKDRGFSKKNDDILESAKIKPTETDKDDDDDGTVLLEMTKSTEQSVTELFPRQSSSPSSEDGFHIIDGNMISSDSSDLSQSNRMSVKEHSRQKKSPFEEAFYVESKSDAISVNGKKGSKSNITGIPDAKELEKESLRHLLEMVSTGIPDAKELEKESQRHLPEMDFKEEELNRKILLNNKGSIKDSVRDLVSLERKKKKDQRID